MAGGKNSTVPQKRKAIPNRQTVEITDEKKTTNATDTEKEKKVTEQQKKRLTPNEQLEKLQEKINQLRQQKQLITNREKEKQRKQRTHRLIQNGALAEKYFNVEGIEPDEFEKILKKLVELSGIESITKPK